MNLTGQMLGKYRLLERLGQGGMAQVYKAIQPTIERVVAIKILHSHLAQSEDLVARFKREARALGQLQHPHIVQVIDFDSAGEAYFMVVDYVPGTTLRDYLDKHNTLPFAEALRITAQLADALDYAHHKGTIHRDIKPGNVIFRDEQSTHAVLTDFGIGKIMKDATMTMTGSIIGTPAYMSPEAVMGQRVDGRTDIYSLGVILYEMVTGRVPYTGDTPMSVIMKQMNEPLQPPRELQPDLPEAVAILIEKALAKEAQHRFQTAGEFLSAIQQVQAALRGGQHTMPLSEPPAYAAPAAKRVEQDDTIGSQSAPVQAPAAQAAPATPAHQKGATPRWPIVAAVGVLLIVLLSVGIWAAQGQSDDEQQTAGGAVVATSETTPTETPQATPTKTAQTTPTETPQATGDVLPTLPGQMGGFRFAENDTSLLGGFTLQMDRVTLPPGGSQYELWLQLQDGSYINLGALAVEDGHILFSGNLEDVAVDVDNRIVVSIEPDTSEPGQATEPGGSLAFIGQHPDNYAASLREVLINGTNEQGFLAGAQDQAGVALQHTGFSAGALAEDNLEEAKQHAEHVINVLDGEEGEFFGDLNLDGQTQNPGDGFGVRAYLQESRRAIAQALESTPITVEQQYHAERSLAALDNSLAALEQAIDDARRLLASDTIEEAQPFIDRVRTDIEGLVQGSPESETLPSARKHALALAAVPMLAEEQNLPAPDPLTETVPGRVGLLRMASNEQARSGDFLLQMARVEVPPEGTHYDAWLIGDTSGENEQNASDTARLFLGELDVLQGHVYLTGSHAENLLESYSRLIVSLEDTPANLLPSEQVVFAGDLTTSITPEVFALLSGEDEDSKGALFGAEEQTRTAIDHKGFAQESLAAGNLDEAKMHLEHVINILDGEDGQHFGDLNLDGQTQNPGDGVGVRGYLLNLISEMETLQETADLTGDQQFHAERISTTATNRLDTIEAAIEQARRGIASDTIAEAQPVITESERLLTELLTGSDLDNNGVIDPLLAEGGITQAQALTLMLNDVHIFPLEIEQTTS